jgi:hypothetical protein
MGMEENYCGQRSADEVMDHAEHVIGAPLMREHVRLLLRCGEDGTGGGHRCDERIILYDGTIEDYRKDPAFKKAVYEGWTILAEDNAWLTVTWLCPKCRDPDFKWPPGYIDQPCEGGE